MGQPKYIVRYCISGSQLAPRQDGYRYQGGFDGTVECVVHGRKVAELWSQQLKQIWGDGCVSFEPFNDPVKHPYKRRKKEIKKIKKTSDDQEFDYSSMGYD